MPDELNLSSLARETRRDRSADLQKKELLKSLFGEETIDRERLEVMEDLLKKSNVQFASVSDKVSIDFLKFISMLGAHELGAFLGEIRRRKDLKDPNVVKNTTVVVSSDLLAEISSCPKKEEDEANTFQVLTGFFAFGMLTGVILTLGGVIISQLAGISLGLKDIGYILGIFLTLLLIPLIIIALQPTLARIQESHQEVMKRMVNFFNGK